MYVGGGGVELANTYLIRHGETDFSQMSIAQGQMNIPINSVGMQTISKMGDYVASNIAVSKVFLSDLLRCKQTCEIIVKKLSYQVDCVSSKSLREISLGVFEGQPMEKLNFLRCNSGDYNLFTPDGGESFNQLSTRIKTWFYHNFDILDNALIISHRGPISVIAEGAQNYSEHEMDMVLKQGNIVKLKLFPNKKYRIEQIIEVVKKYD